MKKRTAGNLNGGFSWIRIEGVAAAVFAVTSLSVPCMRSTGELNASRYSVVPRQKPNPSTQPFGDPRLLEARRALDRGDFAGSLRQVKVASKLGISKAVAAASEAEIFHQTSYLDLEMDSLNKWSKLEMTNAAPWQRMFTIYFELGWTSEADAASKRALALAPNDIRSLMTRSQFFYRSDEPLKAIPYIESALKLDATNDVLLSMEASILIKGQKSDLAVPFLHKALVKKPGNLTLTVALANALIRTGKSSEAEAIFKKIQRDKPDHLEAAYQLGEMAEKRTDWKEAIKQYERVELTDPRFNNVSFRLGNLYLIHGKPEEGRKLLALYKKLDTNSTVYNQTLTRLRRNPRNAELHYRMAQFHVGTQEYPMAIVELKRVLAIQPVHPTARQELAKALVAKGRTTEARTLLTGGVARGKKS